MLKKRNGLRKKTVIFTVGIVLLSLLTFNLFFDPVQASKGESESLEKILVQEGDTLWSIATKCIEPGRDRRVLIGEIRRINRLDSAIIYPGQILLVPVDSAKKCRNQQTLK